MIFKSSQKRLLIICELCSCRRKTVAVCNCFIIREGLVTELCCVLLVNNLVPHIIVNFAVTQGCSYYRKIAQGQVRK